MLFFVGGGGGGDLNRDIITTVNLRQETKHMNIETSTDVHFHCNCVFHFKGPWPRDFEEFI
jgi:hypothetical protein